MSTIKIVGVWLILSLWAAVAQAGTHHHYYTDPQGTVLAKTDAQGNIIATYDYAPYGTAVASMSPAPNGPGYTGHVNDPDSGLVYMQARYYDPVVGRFIGTDAISPAVGNVFNFNRYGYASNNPIINVDLDGNQTRKIHDDDTDEEKRRAREGRDRQGSAGGQSQLVGGSGDSSEQSLTGAERGADAVLTGTFGLYFSVFKRPNHPTKVPDKFAHQLYMTGGVATISALSPYPMILIAGSTPAAAAASVAAGEVAGGVAMRYGPRVLMGACLGGSTCGKFADTNNLPDQYIQDREILRELYLGSQSVGREIFRKVFFGGKN